MVQKKVKENNMVKKIKRKKELVNIQEKNDWIITGIMVCMALLYLLTPLFKGSFFPSTQYRALVFISLVFILVLYDWNKNTGLSFRMHLLDVFILALPVIYFAGIFRAANYGLALNEFIKYVLYCLTYFTVRYIVGKNRNGTHFLLQAVFFSAVVVALAGFLSASGVVAVKDSFYAQRISSTLQYPNSLACCLGAASFLGLFLWAASLENSSKIRSFLTPWPYLYNAGTYFVLTALAGARSIGGLAAFAVVFVIFLILVEYRHRLFVLASIIVTGPVSLLAGRKIVSSLILSNFIQAWFWLILGLLVVIAYQVLLSKVLVNSLLRLENRRRAVNIVLGGAFILAVAGAAVYTSTIFTGSFKELGGRLQTGSFRVDFLEDAARMYLDRPLLGWGGGAWGELYRSYQQYYYNSTQVHSFYGQVAVESGTLGLLAVAGIWICFLLAAFRLYKKGKESGTIAAVVAAAVMIGGHSALDFSLSHSSIAVVLWTMFGIVSGIYFSTDKQDRMEKNRSSGTKRIYVLASTITIIVFLVSFSLAVSDKLFYSSYPKDVRNMELAQKLNPLNSKYYYLSSLLHLNNKEKEKALEHAKKAVALGRYNGENYLNLSYIAFQAGEYDLAYRNAEKGVALAPLVNGCYEYYSHVSYTVAIEKFKVGDKKEAREFLDRTIAINRKLAQKMNSLTEEQKKKWEGAELPAPSGTMLLNAGVAAVLLDDWKVASENLKPISGSGDKRLKSEALFWLSIMNNELGNQEEALKLLKQSTDLNPSLAQKYDSMLLLAGQKL